MFECWEENESLDRSNDFEIPEVAWDQNIFHHIQNYNININLLI